MNLVRAAEMAPRCDVLVIGAGPAGLAAALGAREAGAQHVMLVDREREEGGILWQCIHAGFGLHQFNEELTGPEYAQRFIDQVAATDIEVLTDAFVLSVDGQRHVTLISPGRGMHTVEAKAIVLAMGARERTRPAIHTPGTRPSGVFTAGLAQKYVNLLGYLPGRRAIILGSGDIGLIMARRLTLAGVEVCGVFEIMPYASGLNRNIVQCLHDFNIPLHLSTTVVYIHGSDRVEKVTVAPVDERLRPQLDKSWDIPCDTVLLAVGLIPENELSQKAGVLLDKVTGGPVVDSSLQTSVPGIFACGNVLHIHDLVDYVTKEAFLAGRSAGAYARGETRPADSIRLVPGPGVAYCVPHTLAADKDQTVYLRVRQPQENCRIDVGRIAKRLRYAFPAEMIMLELKAADLMPLRGAELPVALRAAREAKAG